MPNEAQNRLPRPRGSSTGASRGSTSSIEFIDEEHVVSEDPTGERPAAVVPVRPSATALPVKPQSSPPQPDPGKPPTAKPPTARPAAAKRSAAGSVAAWLLLILMVGLFAVFVAAMYLPQREENEVMQLQLQERATELEEQSTELAEVEEELVRTNEAVQLVTVQVEEAVRVTKVKEAEIVELREQHQQLGKAVVQKEEQLAAVQDQLRASLRKEIAAGSIKVTRRGRELVVDLEQKILFTTGNAAVNGRGRGVLSKVADSIRANPKRVFQVAGHTDSVPPSKRLQETYPTNWELSTARATQVVRYLQEECAVPGQQLVAAGYSAYRPKATNKSAQGKRFNRRIEIIMMEKAAPRSKGG